MKLKVLLLILSGWTLIGCGAAKEVDNFDLTGSDLASRTPVDNTNASSIARCNRIAGAGFDGFAQVYSDTYGTLRDDMTRVHLSGLPTSFASSGESLRFYRWLSDDSGTSLNDQPATFYLENRQTGAQIGGLMERLVPSDIAYFSQQAFGRQLSAEEFFAHVNLVLTDIELQYDALKIVAYTGDNSTTQTDFLIPGFAADPNEYAVNHPPALVQMHPNHAEMASGLSTSEYLSATEQFCF